MITDNFILSSSQQARQGHYNEALSMLLEPASWQGLSSDDYNAWASEVWHICALRATRQYVILQCRQHSLTRRCEMVAVNIGSTASSYYQKGLLVLMNPETIRF
jgi:hypothetical protein